MITSCLSKNKIEQGRSGKDSLTGLLQARSSVGWLPVSFQNPAYRELHRIWWHKQLTKLNNGYIIWVSIDTLEGMRWLKKQKLELKVS